MKYIITSVAMVFSSLSPLVRLRVMTAKKGEKGKLEIKSKKIIDKIERKLLNIQSCHFIPLKWTLQKIHEAHEQDQVDDRLLRVLVNEITALHTQCDRLINFKAETFSWVVTKVAMTSIYIFFVVGAVSVILNDPTIKSCHFQIIFRSASSGWA